jgi:recombinational DNA repair protein (RecF pathway)
MAEKVEGIFLARRKHTSGSIIAIFLTEEGLKSYYFRGGEKKSATLYPLSQGTIVYSPGNRTDLQRMSGFELDHTDNFILDPRRLTLAFFMAELLMKCTTENNPDPELFKITKDISRSINEDDGLALVIPKAMIRLMDPLGIRVAIDSTQRERQVFDLFSGEIRNGLSSENAPSGDVVNWIADELCAHETPTDRETAYKALQLLLKYFTLHFPGVQHMKSLEVLHETMN